MARVVVLDSNPLSYEIDKIYCFCNKPDDGEKMVKCGKCNQQYHVACVGYDEKVHGNQGWGAGTVYQWLVETENASGLAKFQSLLER